MEKLIFLENPVFNFLIDIFHILNCRIYTVER